MSNSAKPKILVAYYSLYGHVAALAEAEAKGAVAAGADVKIVQFPETLSADILVKMHAPPKSAAHPIITLDDLKWADGFLIGVPTRYGNAAAQFHSFWNSTGQLWQQGALIGKPAGMFFSTGSQNGGQETTALTTFPSLVHHGLVIVPFGYADHSLFSFDGVHGGGPYGAGTHAGPDGSRKPSTLELNVAEVQGKTFTNTANALRIGREALAAKK